IPPPPGVDVTDPASLAAGIHLFEPRHFLMPFLAHALGTFAGALLAWWLAGSRKDAFAWAIGAVFLAGGIAAARMIAAPCCFVALVLVLGYLPMAGPAIRPGRRLPSRSAPRPA